MGRIHHALRAAAGNQAVGGVTSYFDAVMADSPVAYWRMDETSGATLADSSGNGHDASVDSGITLGSAGLITTGKAITGDGSTTQASTSFNGVTGTSPFSVEVWIQSTSTGQDCWVSWGDTGTGQKVVMRLDSGRPRYEVQNGNIIFDSVVNDGNPHHVVIAFPGGGVQLSNAVCFVDGSQVATASVSSTSVNVGSAYNVRIGQDRFNGRYFGGQIDELAIYDAALSLSQAQNHYNAGIGA